MMKKSVKFTIAISAIIVIVVLIFVSMQTQEQEKIEEYKISLAAQACSLNNRTNAIIDQIEGMSSLEWYMEYTEEQGGSKEEALDTFSNACLNALSEKQGIDSIEPVEFAGKDARLVSAYEHYSNMYEAYNNFYSLIDNPYLPAKDYINEVYAKAQEITDLYYLIQDCYGTSNLEEYAIEDGLYYLYYIEK